MASAPGGPAQPRDRREVPVPKASTLSPYPVPGTESRTGTATRSILGARGAQRIPGPPCRSAQRFKCHLVAPGPVGQRSVPSPWQRALACPPPRTPLPSRSPLFSRDPLPPPHSPFPTFVCLLPPSPPSFLLPLSHIPPFPSILPLLHAGSGLWPPLPGSATSSSRLRGLALQSH